MISFEFAFLHLLLVPMFPTPRSLIVKVAYYLHKAIKTTGFLLGDLASCRSLVLTCSGNTHMVHRILRSKPTAGFPTSCTACCPLRMPCSATRGSFFIAPILTPTPTWTAYLLHCAPRMHRPVVNMWLFTTDPAQCFLPPEVQGPVFAFSLVDVHVAMD